MLALDGCIFRMRNPGRAVKNPMRYWCDSKKTFGLLCMGAADADRRILWWDISYVPTTHDNPAFQLTPFGSRLYSGHMPAPFFASGDSAFTPHPSLMTPGKKRPEFDAYNYEHSSNRMPIEQAWGELYMRWGILWRPLWVEFRRRAGLISCLIRLHNICIDHRTRTRYNEVDGLCEVQPGIWRRPPRYDRKGFRVEYLDTRPDWEASTGQGARVANSAEERRQQLIDNIARLGLRRPPPKHKRT